eukprot:401573_1
MQRAGFNSNQMIFTIADSTPPPKTWKRFIEQTQCPLHNTQIFQPSLIAPTTQFQMIPISIPILAPISPTQPQTFIINNPMNTYPINSSHLLQNIATLLNYISQSAHVVSPITQPPNKLVQNNPFTNEPVAMPSQKPSGKIPNKMYNDSMVKKDAKFQCEICHKQYKHLCNLKTHFRIHTDNCYKCKYCGKKFGRKSNCTEH